MYVVNQTQIMPCSGGYKCADISSFRDKSQFRNQKINVYPVTGKFKQAATV